MPGGEALRRVDTTQEQQAVCPGSLVGRRTREMQVMFATKNGETRGKIFERLGWKGQTHKYWPQIEALNEWLRWKPVWTRLVKDTWLAVPSTAPLCRDTTPMTGKVISFDEGKSLYTVEYDVAHWTHPPKPLAEQKTIKEAAKACWLHEANDPSAGWHEVEKEEFVSAGTTESGYVVARRDKNGQSQWKVRDWWMWCCAP